jgi:hypothetical protein
MVLEILRQAIYVKKLNEKYIVAHSGPLAPHSVSETEWLSYEDRFYNDTSDEDKFIETPSTDMGKIEELLQVESGFFTSPYIVKTKDEHCHKCGRQNNFLDVIATSLRVHRPNFLADVFSGKDGHIINLQKDQSCICYGCGTILPSSATKRSSPKPLSSEAIAAGKKRAFYIYA